MPVIASMTIEMTLQRYEQAFRASPELTLRSRPRGKKRPEEVCGMLGFGGKSARELSPMTWVA